MANKSESTHRKIQSSGHHLVEISGLKKTYFSEGYPTPVLHGVDLKIKAGEFLAIMGPSGSGKSTLMHILGFLDTLSEGKYLFDGVDVSKLSEDDLALIRREKIGFVFQAFFLLPHATVLENVMLPLVYSRGEDHHRQRALAALEAVGLGHRVNFSPTNLSGGEKQRVAIARALVNEPTVIFADEPTGNLDSMSGKQVMEIFQQLNKKGHTIILVTHESVTAQNAERIVRIKDGLIESDEQVKNRLMGIGQYQK